MEPSGREKRALRARGHHLAPLIRVGKEGLTAGHLEALRGALGDSELAKVRFGRRVDPAPILERLERELGVRVVQRAGHTALLYRSPSSPRPKRSNTPT